MQFYRFISINLLVLSSIVLLNVKANDDKSYVDVINSTDQSIRVKGSFFDITVPEFSKMLLQLSKLNLPQNMLHEGIMNNSAEDIKRAVKLGANVNEDKDGNSPILWAILLKRDNAVEALLQCGAQSSEAFVCYALKVNNLKAAALLAQRI